MQHACVSISGRVSVIKINVLNITKDHQGKGKKVKYQLDSYWIVRRKNSNYFSLHYHKSLLVTLLCLIYLSMQIHFIFMCQSNWHYFPFSNGFHSTIKTLYQLLFVIRISHYQSSVLVIPIRTIVSAMQDTNSVLVIIGHPHILVILISHQQ